MSLILEALRKSEAERRRDRAPELTLELPPLPPRRKPALPWASGWPTAAALVLTLALLAVLGWRYRTTTSPHTPLPANPPAPVVTAMAPESAPRVLAPAIPAPPTPTRPPAAPAGDRLRPTPPVSPAVPAPPPPAASPAEIPDLASTGLPPVRMSMHVWDADPTRRFVILDGQRMGEGDRNGTLQVVEIRRDGVILQRDGQRVRLPLP